MDNKPLIEIFEYYKAPGEMQEIANQGGDEDWIVVLNGNDSDGIAKDIADNLAICDYTTIFDADHNRVLYVCTHA